MFWGIGGWWLLGVGCMHARLFCRETFDGYMFDSIRLGLKCDFPPWSMFIFPEKNCLHYIGKDKIGRKGKKKEKVDIRLA